eukprot:CAMPEP_0172682004 /NCGR_PEP_ID=MMETSP1074-20121228/17858_1 /TAXON_ID=2916 /ORGANISM="Ceratium fusus, Strain PA161109" /LENGTH=418 /DNA_ID=CAMNT_0013500605 /DNA_START=36 /DNA_END=1289 /DNA_ORIENTATION=-
MSYLSFNPVSWDVGSDSSDPEHAAALTQRVSRRTTIAVSLLVLLVVAFAGATKTLGQSWQPFLGRHVMEAVLVKPHTKTADEQSVITATTTPAKARPNFSVTTAGTARTSLAVTTRSSAYKQQGHPCHNLQYISMANVLHKNLGRQGPDEGSEGIIYEGAAVRLANSSNGGEPRPRPVMVELHASNETPLVTDPQLNGMVGQYARLNIQHGTRMLFRVRFLDGLTLQPKVMHSIDFTFFDLDMHVTGNEVKYVKLWGFSSFALTRNTEVNVAVDPIDGSTTFQGTMPGTDRDRPTDPWMLSSEQKNKAVTLHFEDVADFKVELGSINKIPHWGAHHNFLFVAQPSLQCGQTIGADTTGGIMLHSQTATAETMTNGTTMVASATTKRGNRAYEARDGIGVAGVAAQANLPPCEMPKEWP